MPVQVYPIQPQYDDALTEADMLRAQGVAVPASQQPISQTYEKYTPNAQDLQGTALQEQYAKAQQEALNKQQLGLEQYQHDIDALRGRPTQVDLSPLAALADAWGVNKSNFAETYKRPMTAQEQQQQLMGLQEKLQAARDKIADNRTQALAAAIAAHKANKEEPLKAEELRSKIRLNDALAGNRQATGGLTPGQKAADVNYGKEYQDWRAQGGYANVEENINALERAATMLEQNPNLTGGATSMLSDSVRKRVAPDAFALQQMVEQAGQAGLRQTMGPQFTEREGLAFLARLFDPALSGQENARRIRVEVEKLKKQAQAKEQSANYFEKTGSLKGLDTTQQQMAPEAVAGSSAVQTPSEVERARYEELKKKAAEPQ